MEGRDKDCGRDAGRRTTGDYPQSSRTDCSRGTPGRASIGGAEIVMDLAGTKPVMVDSYLSKFDSVMSMSPEIPRRYSEPEVTEVQDLATGRSTDRSFVTDCTTPGPGTHRSQPTGRLSKRSRRGDYGLSIITWDEFLECPKGFNDLFFLERGDLITFDPDEVNVFFHDSLMMQPMLGSPSGDGKTWTIFIESLSHLKQVRLWMLERVSVITAIIKNNKITATTQGQTAPCLIAINPNQSSVREHLEQAFEQSWESVLARRRYCIEINLGACVEEWCQTAFNMKCKVKTTKLYITNGDEYAPPNIQSKKWRIACYPCLSIQRLMYKMQRRNAYDDYFVDFKSEPISICTGSKLMQIYAGPSSTRRPGLKKSVSIKVTTSTQTLDDRRSSETSESPDESFVEDGYDNDAFDDRGEDVEDFNAKTPTPRLSTQHEANLVPRPGSRMGGDFSKRTFIESTRSEKNMRVIMESPVPISDGDDTPEKITKAKVEAYVESIPNSVEEPPSILTTPKRHTRKGLTTVSHGLGGSALDLSQRLSDLPNLASPGRVESHVKPKIAKDATTLPEKPPTSTTSAGSSKPQQKNEKGKKRIGKILKEILSNNDQNKTSESETNVEAITSFSESKLIVVGSEKTREDLITNEIISQTVQEMLPPSKENTSSSGFDDAMSSVSEIISPRKNKNKTTPLFVEPQRNAFFPNRKNGKVRHAFSDVDQDEDEFTDYEPDSVMSDNFAVNSPRLVAVKRANKTPNFSNRVAVISDLDSDLEVFDMDDEEPKKENVSSTPVPNSLKVPNPPKYPNPHLIRGPKGQRNSRRRYLALNSLRKKTRVGLQQPELRR
ncbi:hypothetical protein LOTGIDRAFT_158308 [Lottia gigantea]|uniref:Uncharacterized protein n=1 Tax=Lottia gigantea TaxID=225164 RepID=V4AYD8_LOTGI|nr:hypothetical protein LOTGIDRAFT_158308 [Lottia gigantea]ESP00076.1 hypothetical protein LOTGIDRAFT_158308 [Lottia gigantea]